ncbi:hypothetical protein CAP35_01690 [Chitinophagaceae bacterium IBVUCB1]|nr:hypothetical protein CAP35_01690 [Chitinophagaceae bacterium IBVUCB1]
MLFNRIFFLSVVLLFSSLSHFANAADIIGKVMGSDKQPLPSANVVLLKTDSKTLVKADMTDEGGSFSFDNIPDGEYVLKITTAGYEIYNSDTIRLTGAGVTLPAISMQPKAGSLKEVTVRSQKPLIEIKADKLIVNVENSIINAGSSVLDVIARSPGVRVDQNDNISLKGKAGVNVMIDGRRTVMSGADLANMLKSMPSGAVEQIEIITNPSSRYDAAGTAGIINIKTKKDKRFGVNGSVNGFYAQGVYPKLGGGFSLNYRNKKFNMNASYNYAHRKAFNHLTLYRSFYDKGVFQNAYDQDNMAKYGLDVHNAALGMDYSISKKTSIGLNMNTDITGFDINGNNNSKILDANKHIQSYFTTINRSANTNQNYAANINLRHKFDSTGKELSVDADYGTFTAGRDQHFTTRYINTNGQDYLPKYLLMGDLNGTTTIRSVKTDYIHPLQNNLRLEAGAKWSYVTQDNNVQFFDQSNGTNVFDTTKSNHFIYTENINAVYVNSTKDWQKWSTQIGLRYEQTIATGEQKIYAQNFDRNYAQLFPSLAVQRHVNDKHDIGITLSRRITRPNYEQLNPFKYYLDPSTYKAGYPFLMPELIYVAEVSHTYKQRFVTSFNYSILDQPITEVIQPSDDTNQKRVTVQTNKNLSRQYFTSLSGSYQFQFFKWWTNVTNANLYYSQFQGNIANSQLNRGQLTFDLYSANSFILPKNWSGELSFFYQSQQIHGYMLIHPLWSLSAGVQKHLFDKRLTMRLNCTDIFWRSYPTASSSYTDYTERFTAQRETRQLSMTITYRFGKRTVAPVQRRKGGAEDEKRRAATGNA